MANSDKRSSVGFTGLAGLLGGGTGAVFGLLLAVVVGRYLGPNGAGLFFQMVALFMILANVLELGADTGLVRELSRQVTLNRFADLRRTVVAALVPVMVVGALVTWAVWTFAPGIGELISPPATSATAASLISNTVPFVAVAALFTVLLAGSRGLGRMLPFVGLFNVSLPVLRVLTVLLAAGAGAGVVAAAQAWVWPLLAVTAIAAVLLARHLAVAIRAGGASEQPKPMRAVTREFWSFSGPRGVGAAVEIMLAWADVLIVGAVLGPAEAGVYAVASRAARAGLLVETATRMVISPSISAALAGEERGKVRDLYAMATQWMILLAWPLYITLALFAPLVLDLFGAEFDSGAACLIALCGAMLLLSFFGLVQSVLLMGGYSRKQLRNKTVALVVNAGGNIALLPVLGIVAAGLCWIATVLVDSLMAVWQVRHRMRVQLALGAITRLSAVVLACFAVPGLLVRVLLGATPVALAVHLVLSTTVLAATVWGQRRRLGVVSPLARSDYPDVAASPSS